MPFVPISRGRSRPFAHSIGIEAVWVNGTAVRKDGADLDAARPGEVLRSW